ncbi:SRPBCC family protein [Streptomyces albus subsp. chlorinus]|uniref:SRPBCC family protein n=1 Tax=Streptomyces albus TaxID=1888 RepID=UPI003D12A0E5
MERYELSTTVAADADAVFAYLSDLATLPGYVECVRSAEHLGGTRVRVVADAGGRTRTGEAWLTTDAGSRTAAWESCGPRWCAGQVYVTDAAPHGARVTLGVQADEEACRGLRPDLEAALARLRRLLESGGAHPA